jgi:hypothetical protein
MVLQGHLTSDYYTEALSLELESHSFGMGALEAKVMYEVMIVDPW